MRSGKKLDWMIRGRILLMGVLLQMQFAQGQVKPVSQTISLSGSVVDPTGAVIPGAMINLKDGDKLIDNVKTDSNGRFQLQVRPGDYTLATASPGFRTDTRSLRFAEILPTLESVNITLQVGSCSPCVDVQPTLPPLPLLTSTLSSRLAARPLPRLKVSPRNLTTKPGDSGHDRN